MPDRKRKVKTDSAERLNLGKSEKQIRLRGRIEKKAARIARLFLTGVASGDVGTEIIYKFAGLIYTRHWLRLLLGADVTIQQVA